MNCQRADAELVFFFLSLLFSVPLPFPLTYNVYLFRPAVAVAVWKSSLCEDVGIEADRYFWDAILMKIWNLLY